MMGLGRHYSHGRVIGVDSMRHSTQKLSTNHHISALHFNLYESRRQHYYLFSSIDYSAASIKSTSTIQFLFKILKKLNNIFLYI